MLHTLRKPISIIGTGLHSGRPARLRILPGAAGFGIWFRRVDVADRDNMIPALWDHVYNTELSTNLQNDAGVGVSTIEHLMAALAGCGVQNAIIEIDGPEVPIMDGSAKRFVAEIRRAGIVAQNQPGSYWEIRQPVRVESGLASAELAPFDGFRLGFSITFENTVIGHQSLTLDMRHDTFARELADCRTFCRLSDVTAMQAHNRALGGSLDNALVVDGPAYVNPEGPRRPDECVRHKMLDAVGDLALAGAPILGAYHGHRAGHALTNTLLRTLFETPGAAVLRPMDARVHAYFNRTENTDSGLLRVG